MAVIIKVEKNKNFTVMSNIHLRDNKIDLKAKGLMSLILSLPPSWNYTINGLLQFATDGRDSFAKTMTKLESAGYLHRERERNEKGHVKDNLYVFYENPDDNPYFKDRAKPITENPSQADITKLSNDNCDSFTKESIPKPITGNPFQATYTKDAVKRKCNSLQNEQYSPITAFPAQDKPTQENRPLINKDIINKDIINTYSSSAPQNDDDDMESIKKRINYNELINHYSAEKVNEFIFILSDVAKLPCKSIRINGKAVKVDTVKSEFKQLKYEHISYVLDCLNENNDIRNRRAYILTSLYNARHNYDLYSAKKQSETNHSYDLDEYEQFAMHFSLSSQNRTVSPA